MATRAEARVGLPSMMRAQPPPDFATWVSASPGLSDHAGSRAVGSGTPPAPRRAAVPGSFYKAEGGGAPVGVGVRAVGGGGRRN